MARDDPETLLTAQFDGRGVDLVDPGQGGGFTNKPPLEALDARGRALDLDQDPFGVVADMTGELELSRQTVHERPEADPLDHAGHSDPVTHRKFRGDQGGHSVAVTLFRPRVTAASRCMRPKL